MTIPELTNRESSLKTFLLLETSELECGVAIYQAGKVIAKAREQQPRKHGDLLLALVESVLVAGHIKPSELTAIAVVSGPGAFTGIRIGVAMAQGLAYGWGIPCIPVNTLDLWALSTFSHHPVWSEVMCMMDARMGEVYFAHYRRGHDQIPPQAHVHTCCIKPQDIDFGFQFSHSELDAPVVGLVGSGALVYKDLWVTAAKSHGKVLEFADEVLCYSSFGILAEALLSQGKSVSALDLDALYLRPAVVS